MARDEPLTIEEQQIVDAAERRIAAHLEEIDRAKSEGRLAELIRGVPPVRDQIAAVEDSLS
jgi:hypothetical protein